MRSKACFAAIAALAFSVFAGCATHGQTGAAIGAPVGIVAGGIIGHQSGHRDGGALIGGVVGTLAGYAIGNEMDKADQDTRMDEISRRSDQAYAAANTIIVTVRNSNGSYIDVPLQRQGPYLIGPRGERYLTLPTEDQLRPVYGF